MDEKLQDRIDEYILDRMSDRERKAFEDDLEKDVRLREQYNYTKMVEEVVSEHEQLGVLMSLWDMKIEQEQPYRKMCITCCMKSEASPRAYASIAMDTKPAAVAKPKRKIWLWVLGVAAALLVGLFLVHPFTASEKEYNYTSIMEDGATRDGGDLGVIDSLMVLKEYDTALALIETEERYLYSVNDAASSSVDAMPDDTIDTEAQEQEEYKRHELQQRKDDLAWMKANALVALGRKDEAKELLDQIRKGNGEYKDRAEALYKQIAE